MFALPLKWDWLFTKEDKRLIAQAKEQEQIEIEKTAIFLERLKRIEPETIVGEIERLYRNMEKHNK